MSISSVNFEGTVRLAAGSITNGHISNGAAIARDKLALDSLKIYDVKLTDFRIWDAFATPLTATAGTDDLGLVGGTFATGSPYIGAGDLKAAGATTRYARVLIPLPAEYADGQTVKIRFFADMLTTVADTSCTIDIQAYESDGEGGISADLCTTSATDMNSLVGANIDFTLTATDLVAGDLLDVRVAIACTDAATATVVTPRFGKCQLLCDVRG